jgi:hypothetical protein
MKRLDGGLVGYLLEKDEGERKYLLVNKDYIYHMYRELQRKKKININT